MRSALSIVVAFVVATLMTAADAASPEPPLPPVPEAASARIDASQPVRVVGPVYLGPLEGTTQEGVTVVKLKDKEARQAGAIVLHKVMSEIDGWKQISEGSVRKDDPDYWLLLKNVNSEFKGALKAIEREYGFNWIGEVGFLKGRQLPDLTSAVIEKVKKLQAEEVGRPPGRIPRRRAVPRRRTVGVNASKENVEDWIALALSNSPEVKQAESNLALAQAELKKAKLQLAHNVAQVCSEIAEARNAFEAAKRTLKTYGPSLDTILKEGVLPPHLEQARTEVLGFEGRKMGLLNKLRALAGQMPGDKPEEKSLEKWVNLALENSPDLEIARTKVQQADAALEEAKRTTALKVGKMYEVALQYGKEIADLQKSIPELEFKLEELGPKELPGERPSLERGRLEHELANAKRNLPRLRTKRDGCYIDIRARLGGLKGSLGLGEETLERIRAQVEGQPTSSGVDVESEISPPGEAERVITVSQSTRVPGLLIVDRESVTPERVTKPRTLSPEDERIWKKLQETKVTVEFGLQAPLKDIVESLRTEAGISIVLDQKLLTSGRPLTILDFVDITTADAVAHICAVHHPPLRYAVARGAVVISQDIDAYLARLERMPRAEAKYVEQRQHCRDNLARVGQACGMYAAKHGGKLPQTLEEIRREVQIIGSTVLFPVCSAPPYQPYEYAGGGLVLKDNPDAIVAFCKEGSHPGGRNVLFVDGHTEWLTEDAFEALARKHVVGWQIDKNEEAAIGTLKAIAKAQQTFQTRRYVDQDVDGIGEYGFLREIAGALPGRGGISKPRPEELLAVQPGKISGSQLVKHGYVYHMFLPSGPATGRGFYQFDDARPESSKLPAADARHADAQEARWCCYGWPLKRGEAGNRAFVINHKGHVFETDNRRQRYGGAGGGPKTGNEAFTKGTRNLKGELANHDKDGLANDAGKWQPVK